MPATLIDIAPAYIVLRPFSARGRELGRGEVIDCRDWRNVQPLVNVRKLKPIPYEMYDADPIECGCGRRWDSEESLAVHGCASSSIPPSPAPTKNRGGRPRKITSEEI
jgi:hypothetical protein